MSKEIGIGIAGCGMIAAFHAKAIAAMDNARVVAVYGRSKEKAENFAQEHGCMAFSDYDAFLQCEGLDVVSVATPSGKHLEPARDAAQAGKHVICEKPLEVSLERLDEMSAACAKSGVLLSGIFPRRYNGAVRAIKQALSEGRLGQINSASAYIKWYRTQDYYDSGAWRGTWNLDGGGALMNQSIHTIDLLIHFAGEVESVCAFADRLGHDRIEVEDIAVAVLRFRSGALGTIEGTTAAYSPDGHPASVELCGNDGSVFLVDDRISKWEFREEREADAAIIEEFGLASDIKGAGAADPSAIDFIGHQRNFEDFLQSVGSGKPVSIDGVESRKALEVILAIYESALNGGKRVDLPLKRTPELRSFKSD